MATLLKDYELMLIYTPVLTDDEYKAAQAKIASLITENGGEIVNANPWGLRSLAYPIEKKTTAFYHVIEFKAPADYLSRLTVIMNRDENILRHMVTALDKYAVAYNAKRHNGAKKQEA